MLKSLFHGLKTIFRSKSQPTPLHQPEPTFPERAKPCAPFVDETYEPHSPGEYEAFEIGYAEGYHNGFAHAWAKSQEQELERKDRFKRWGRKLWQGLKKCLSVLSGVSAVRYCYCYIQELKARNEKADEQQSQLNSAAFARMNTMQKAELARIEQSRERFANPELLADCAQKYAELEKNVIRISSPLQVTSRHTAHRLRLPKGHPIDPRSDLFSGYEALSSISLNPPPLLHDSNVHVRISLCLLQKSGILPWVIGQQDSTVGVENTRRHRFHMTGRNIRSHTHETFLDSLGRFIKLPLDMPVERSIFVTILTFKLKSFKVAILVHHLSFLLSSQGGREKGNLCYLKKQSLFLSPWSLSLGKGSRVLSPSR